MNKFQSIDEIYKYYATKIIDAPTAAPRNLLIKELIGEGFELLNPRKRILRNSSRNASLPFAVGEFMWYLRGSNSVEIMQYYSKMYPKFSDDGVTAHGAYGPRIFCEAPESNSPWQSIIELLKCDPDSRQAVIPIYHPGDVGLSSKDIPCTCVLQFLLRDNKLNCITYMRSNDLYLGLPYDVFSFTLLQEVMALSLGVELGTYKHVVGSLHVYEKHFTCMESIALADIEETVEMPKMTPLIVNQKSRILEEEERIRVTHQYDPTNIDEYWRALLFYLLKKAGIESAECDPAYQ